MTSTVPQNNLYASSSAASSPLAADATYQPQFLSFSGRIGRVRYLAYSFGILLLGMPLIGAAVGLGAVLKSPILMGLLTVVLYIGLLVAQFTFGRRRLNDLDQSGWWMLLNFVPLANLGLAIYLMFFPGSQQNNRFGAPPKANTTGLVVLACVFPVVFVVGILAAVSIPAYNDYVNKARAKAEQQQGLPALPDAAEAPAAKP